MTPNPLVRRMIKEQSRFLRHAYETRQRFLWRRYRENIRILWKMRNWSSDRVSKTTQFELGVGPMFAA